MTVLEFVILLLVAAVCGIIAQAIVGFTRGGLLAAIALGFIGALVGMWMARQASLPEFFVVEAGEVRFPIVWSIIGATLFVAVVSLISRRPTA